MQLTAATQTAENLSLKLGKPIRVLGWYHSHPHITVQPSHVGKFMCFKFIMEASLNKVEIIERCSNSSKLPSYGNILLQEY